MAETQYERIESVIFLGTVYGWELVEYNFKIKAVKLKQKGVKLTYWYDRGLVFTIMNHPKHGISGLIRKHISEDEFESILSYPRKHTKKGKLVRHYQWSKYKI